MKIDLSKIHKCAKCEKPYGLQRHHKGCEKMWLRHFAARRHREAYRAFETRYWEFREEDIVRLCEKCHLKIHKIYIKIIRKWVEKHGKCSDWTWGRAYGLMTTLRARCDLWLKNPKKRSKLHRAK